MTVRNSKIPKKGHHHYKEGDLIIKAGDHGLFIYKILFGKVQMFKEVDGREVPLATLGIGDIIGEMLFLKGKAGVHAASARALEDSEVEVWDLGALLEQYAQAPVVLKYLIDQRLNRLLRMNEMLDRLTADAEKVRAGVKPKKQGPISRRRYYRRKVDLDCTYLPIRAHKGLPSHLNGRIKDISMTGLCLETSPRNASVVSHNVGDSFRIETVLPNGEKIRIVAEIIDAKKAWDKIRLGMLFDVVADYSEAKKALGFFLLP